MLSFFRGVSRLVLADLSLLRRNRMLRLAVLAVSMVPAVYALIYLSSVWDPNAKTSALPAALVNLDTGVHYRDQSVNVGRELSDAIESKAMFGWRRMDDPVAARHAVETGALSFAVIIPKDFSAQAVPGAVAGGGRIRVILSEGNNYSSAGFARRFALELGHQVNETLNEKRWAMVLSTAEGSQKSLEKLKSGVAQLRAGAQAQTDGTGKFTAAATELAGGFRQVAGGVRTMESRLPPEADLKALKSGAQQLVAGQHELGGGLEQLRAGASRLADGARQLEEQGGAIPLFGDKVAKGANELAAGAGDLTDGLGRAHSASGKLAQGAVQLESGVTRLADGVGALGGGVRSMTARLPADAQLDAVNAGGAALQDGAARLLAGVKLVESALPASVSKLEGSARGLADSVETELENLSPVPNNGSAFAPNMVAVALWIGAVMAAYLFNLNLMPLSQMDAPRLAQTLGKFIVPAGITVMQVVLVYFMLVDGLGVPVPSAANLLLTMTAASWAFLAMLFALLRVFGEASKLLAVLVLTLQLAAGGGVIPVELSGGLFQSVHDWLPFTWVVKAFRASLFGAFDHGWLHAWDVVLLAGLTALLIAAVIGRWKVVPDAQYKAGVDL